MKSVTQEVTHLFILTQRFIGPYNTRKNIFLNKTAGSKYISLILKWSKSFKIYGQNNLANNKYSLRIERTS